jgi:protein-tyrosine-phosphatase
MRQVLFVCTGNVFRSLAAEYALRAALHPRTEFLVASAGIDDRAQPVPPEIVDYLRQKNFDVSTHRRRTLTRQLVDAADVVIAMSLDHRDFIRERFGRDAPLFLECCGHGSEALLDLHEAVRDYRSNRAAALAYIRTTIDRIVELTPRLIGRILDHDSQRLAMASRRKNIRKAAGAARRKGTIAHLPKKTRRALGKEASKVAKRKKRRG